MHEVCNLIALSVGQLDLHTSCIRESRLASPMLWYPHYLSVDLVYKVDGEIVRINAKALSITPKPVN
jgi:hypothetical protein